MTPGERPAIAGGTPIRTRHLPYGRHHVTDDDVAAVLRTLRSDWLTTGPTIELFEQRIARWIGAAHVVSVSSGTAALHAACAAAHVGHGDEVVVPPLTHVATANAVVFQGARPVFADVDPSTWTLNPSSAMAAVTPKTRAVVIVHFAGAAADLGWTAPLRDRGIAVIEDAAHAFGAIGTHGPVGGESQLAAFSFHPVKLFTTAEGGAVATNDGEAASAMRRFRNHGIDTELRERERTGTWRYQMVELGWNYRLTDIGAALGLAQLERVDAILASRRALARRYVAALAGSTRFVLPKAAADRHAWHIFTLAVRPGALRVGRDEIVAALRAEGIGANVHYAPVHLQPFYRQRYGHREGDLPAAEDICGRIFTIPLFPEMTERDQDDVLCALDRVARWYES